MVSLSILISFTFFSYFVAFAAIRWKRQLLLSGISLVLSVWVEQFLITFVFALVVWFEGLVVKFWLWRQQIDILLLKLIIYWCITTHAIASVCFHIFSIYLLFKSLNVFVAGALIIVFVMNEVLVCIVTLQVLTVMWVRKTWGPIGRFIYLLVLYCQFILSYRGIYVRFLLLYAQQEAVRLLDGIWL